MLEHGGHLIDAAKQHNIPKDQWVDLSTGINPNGWPIPPIPAECWQRLPESSDGLLTAAQGYYQNNSILAVAGSQAAIQTLPLLYKKSNVGVLAPAYAEHAYNWEKAGHKVIELSIESIQKQLPLLDILILINPNNPTGQHFNQEQLLDWHQKLRQHKGCLIIDEAFIDSTPEKSLSNYPVTEGLIILRSVGKFFGLAGIRCGFVIASKNILTELNELLGPWTISHPSRYITTAALLDNDWQAKTRLNIKAQSIQLAWLLTKHHLPPTGSSDLFQWIKTVDAEGIYQALAKQGVLIRLFTKPLSLRFGLPQNDQQWQKLSIALSKLNIAQQTTPLKTIAHHEGLKSN